MKNFDGIEFTINATKANYKITKNEKGEGYLIKSNPVSGILVGYWNARDIQRNFESGVWTETKKKEILDGIIFKTYEDGPEYIIKLIKGEYLIFWYPLRETDKGTTWTCEDLKEHIDNHWATRIEPQIKQENMKAKTFSITGKPHQLESIIKDLVELGYNYKRLINKNITLTCVCNNDPKYNDLEDLEEFKYISGVNWVETYRDVKFSLPGGYEKALEFAKAQLSPELWEKEEELKVGDTIYFLKKFDGAPLGHITTIINIHPETYQSENCKWISYSPSVGDGGGFRVGGNGCVINKDFRKVTEEEILVYNQQKEEKALLEEAVKRGFVEGAKFIGASGADNEFSVKGKLYIRSGNIYSDNSGCIYQGLTKKWATIIPSSTILILGSNNVKMGISKEGITCRGSNIDVNGLKNYLANFEPVDIGAWNIYLSNKESRVFRIGCTSESNLFSYNELKQALDEYDKLNK